MNWTKTLLPKRKGWERTRENDTNNRSMKNVNIGQFYLVFIMGFGIVEDLDIYTHTGMFYFESCILEIMRINLKVMSG